MIDPTAIAARLTEARFYICDLRPEWRRNWAVTFWRPDNAGYAYPLSWAGKYSAEKVKKGGSYYAKRSRAGDEAERPGKTLIRFPVPCEVAEAMAVASPPGKIDGDAGPVVMNNGKNRIALRKAGRAVLAELDKEPPK